MNDGRNNLIPMSERSKDEARELGRRGGIESGKTRRRRSSLMEAGNVILAAPIKDKDIKKELRTAGVGELNANSLFMLRLYKGAVSGNTQAARLFAQIIGESDVIHDEATKAKIDIEFLKLELANKLLEEPEPNLKFLEALGVNVAELIPKAVDMGGTSIFMDVLRNAALHETVPDYWRKNADQDPADGDNEQE